MKYSQKLSGKYIKLYELFETDFMSKTKKKNKHPNNINLPDY